jgi:hypothetical protein
VRRRIAYSREGYDGVTRYRRPFGVYEYGVLVRANCQLVGRRRIASFLPARGEGGRA